MIRCAVQNHQSFTMKFVIIFECQTIVANATDNEVDLFQVVKHILSFDILQLSNANSNSNPNPNTIRDFQINFFSFLFYECHSEVSIYTKMLFVVQNPFKI